MNELGSSISGRRLPTTIPVKYPIEKGVLNNKANPAPAAADVDI
jgi:hypothetical protein